jgi:hypothetical protein
MYFPAVLDPATSTLARSALPGAPIVPFESPSSPRRFRLRRSAERLAR